MTGQTARKMTNEPAQAKTPLSARLFDRGWILAFAGCGLLFLVLFGWLEGSVAVLFFAGLVLCALTPLRLQEVKGLQTRAKAPGKKAIDLSLRRIMGSLPVPSLLINRQGAVQFFNKGAEKVLPNLAVGETLSLRLRQPEVAEAMRQAIQKSMPAELEYTERVPVERWYRLSISPLQNMPKARTGRKAQNETGLSAQSSDLLLVQFYDLSEQKRTERMRVDFIANASHELRTPLASMSGFIETMMGSAKDDEATKARFLAIMQEQAERMSRLIDDLLSLSRIEMKEHMRPTDTVDLRRALSHVLDALAPLAGENGVTFATDWPDRPVTVTGDENELVQVFNNLIENAIKYGASGQKADVILKAAAPADSGGPDAQPKAVGPCVIIRDYGPGIGSAHVPRLTERFYRADAQAGQQKKGTGLGLAIVKHILNRHGARLEIKTSPGKGAQFTVLF